MISSKFKPEWDESIEHLECHLQREMNISLATWRTDTSSERILQSRRSWFHRKLLALQKEIIYSLGERQNQIEMLRKHIKGGKKAKNVLKGLTTRSKALTRLVKQYNKECFKLDSDNFFAAEGPDAPAIVRCLDLDDLKDQAWDYDNLWDINRTNSTEDWARYDYVRQGMEACHRLARIPEERQRLLTDVNRMSRWALDSGTALVHHLQVNVTASSFRSRIRTQLLHVLLVAESLMAIKNRDLLPEEMVCNLRILADRIMPILEHGNTPIETVSLESRAMGFEDLARFLQEPDPLGDPEDDVQSGSGNDSADDSGDDGDDEDEGDEHAEYAMDIVHGFKEDIDVD